MGSRQRSCPKPLSPTRRQPGLPLRASRSASQARCAQVLPDPAVQLSAATFVGIREGVRGASLERNRCVRVSAPVSGSFPPPPTPLFPGRLRLPGQGRGQVLACASPLMPRPGAQIPASGGGRETPGPSTRPGPRLLRRAGQPEPGREREARPGSGFATCPGAPHPETQDLQVLLPQIQAFRLQPSSLRPGSPNLSSPPSEPGVQASALLLQTLRVQTPHLLV